MISRHSSQGTSLITGNEVKCARIRTSQRSRVRRQQSFSAGSPVAARYLRFLADAGLVRPTGRGVYRLGDERVVSFGGTLEWYVAQVLAREFECASAHGLRIAHAAHGGDYDVIACTEGEVL